MSPKIVTLTSDFGMKDAYAAEMKAAILNICPAASIVDVTHEVEKFNVREGAFVVASAAPYFSDGVVHVVVVDPGVGTQRRPIIVETRRSFFVGPDNGVLMLAAEDQGILHVREITSRRFMLPHVSHTFHGRDIFAPVAAHLANGIKSDEFGPIITDEAKPQFTVVTRSHDSVTGEVLHVDDFGNTITNIPARDIAGFRGSMVHVTLPGRMHQMRILSTYGEARLNEPLVLVGSHGYAEITVNQGNAAAQFGSKAGDKVTLSRA